MPDGVQLELLGLSIMALPPGAVEVEMRNTCPMINVSSNKGRGSRIFEQIIEARHTPSVEGFRRGHFDLYARWSR